MMHQYAPEAGITEVSKQSRALHRRSAGSWRDNVAVATAAAPIEVTQALKGIAVSLAIVC